MAACQQLSPGWEQPLACALTGTTSDAGAAALLRQLGHTAEDATLHALAQKLGARAEAQTQQRLQPPAPAPAPPRAASEVGVRMLDDWPVRQRGPGWGKQQTPQARVAGHAWQTGGFYRQEQAARKNGRSELSGKVGVRWQGEPLELGRRRPRAACEHGLGRARQKRVVRDGAPWIWNVVADRWPGAVEVLDFYHASQPVGNLGEALKGDREAARPWGEQPLHPLRHGRHAAARRTLAGWTAGAGPAGEVIRREQHDFAGPAGRRNYQAVAARGWAIGSGAVEPACRQRQGRFKRSGQFWAQRGHHHLCALIEARQHGHWDPLCNQ